jgi:glycosyltransferase involved in cell wall biosynthesis
MTRIDVVVAVRDEEESIPRFVNEVRGLRLPEGVGVRMLFVEDSSRDQTRAVLRQLARQASDVTYYAVENRFGQGLALVFGIARSGGDAVIAMDVDGTHPPHVIPVLVDRFLRGNDVVQCVRRTLPDRKLYRNLGATTFHLAAGLLTGVDTRRQNVYFRLMAAGVAKDLLRHRRYWRFLRFPLPDAPGRLSFVDIDTMERSVGRSKYTFLKLTALALDGVISLLTRTRLMSFLAVLIALAAVMWQLGSWWLSVSMLAVAGMLVARYVWLGWYDPLERITILESAEGRQAYAVERCAG